jgi:hypothetical protein
MVQLPPIGMPLKIQLVFDEAYNLPYIVRAMADGILATSLSAHYRQNVYILAIRGYDPVTVTEVLDGFRSFQVPHATKEIEIWIVKHNNLPRTDIEEKCSMFSQDRVAPVEHNPLSEPVVCRAVTSMIKPECPKHAGQMVRIPFQADFKFAHFEIYDIMYQTGTWSYPVDKSVIPPAAVILPIHSTYSVKSIET